VDLVTVNVMSLVEGVWPKKASPPWNTTEFLTGIDLSIRQCHPLEVARLVIPITVNKSPALLKVDSYLATHMNERGT
jgi:hypothetical protein